MLPTHVRVCSLCLLVIARLSLAELGFGPICFQANITIVDHLAGVEVTKEFLLYYSNLLFWRERVVNFIGQWSFALEADKISSVTTLSDHVSNFLNSRAYPPEIIAGLGDTELPREIAVDPVSASRAVYYLLHNAYSYSGTGVYDFTTLRQRDEEKDDLKQYDAENFNFYAGLRLEKGSFLDNIRSDEKSWQIISLANTEVSQYYGKKDNHVKIFHQILNRYHGHEQRAEVIEDLLRSRSPLLKSSFIVYQTRFVNTGGTTALNILYEILVELMGSSPDRVLLCNEDNYMTAECAKPSDDAIVITGEWCHEVLADHGVAYHKGRGIQYHLGFHHYRDMCAGHVAMTDSHYLHSYLGERVLGGYFLSCPMSTIMEGELVGLINRDEKLSMGVGVAKENLVVIDPDFGQEYHPAAGLNITLPRSIRVVYAKDVPHKEMPLLLQRAKVVVDLAIPGPERLMGEGILNGAIPIGSSRWNGASVVDFPGVERVDTEDPDEVSEAIKKAVLEYSDRLSKPRNVQFFGYIASLRERTKNTLEVICSSASLHFVLSPRTLKQERESVFQTMALLYVFPLASIDILVNDEMWYCRQNYPFIKALREAGYLREDTMEPWLEEYVGVSGTVSGSQRGSRPQSRGKDTGQAWSQAKWHHERGKNKAFVNIRSRATVYASVAQQRDYEASISEGSASLVSQSEICPSWGAVVVALSSGIVFQDHRDLLKMASSALGTSVNRELLVQSSDKAVTMIHPASPLITTMRQSWYTRFYGNADSSSQTHHDSTIAGVSIELKSIHVSSIFECPSLDARTGNGGEKADITVLKGVVQSAAWLLLRSHYCNQLHP